MSDYVDILESTFIEELEGDFLHNVDVEARSKIVSDVCTVSRVLSDSEKTKAQSEADASRIALERDKLAFEKEKFNLEQEKLALEQDKLSFEKEEFNLERDKLAADAEDRRRGQIWDAIKTAGGWAVTLGVAIGGWIFANRMAEKSFHFEEEGTLSSMTSRKFFNKW